MGLSKLIHFIVARIKQVVNFVMSPNVSYVSLYAISFYSGQLMHISINKNTFVVTVRYITIVYKSYLMDLYYCFYIFIVSCSLHVTEL